MTMVQQTKEAGIVIVLEASDSGELTQKWNSRKAKHVHADHLLSLSRGILASSGVRIPQEQSTLWAYGWSGMKNLRNDKRPN